MARKKGGEPARGSPQLVVRLSEQMDKDLRAAASGLDLDVSNLVRMLLAEHLGDYIQRGIRARKKLREARAELSAAEEDRPAAGGEAGAAPTGPSPRGTPGEENVRNLEV